VIWVCLGLVPGEVFLLHAAPLVSLAQFVT
jgi:hypothetical protein